MCRLLFVCAVVLVLADRLYSQGGSGLGRSVSPGSSEGQFVLSSIWARGREIQSGVGSVLATGRTIEGEFKFWFDHSINGFRVDRMDGERKMQAVWTPAYVLYHPPTSGVISRFRSDYVVSSTEVPKLDFRFHGLAQAPEFFHYDLMQFKEHVLNDGTVESINVNGSEVRVEWEAPRGPQQARFSRTIWFDESRGFVTTEIRDLITSEDGTQVLDEGAGSFTYLEKNGILVPDVCTYEHSTAASKDSWSLRFEWENVNQAIEPTVFEALGLNAPGGTMIVDSRLGGEPLVEATIPRDGVDDWPGGKQTLFAPTSGGFFSSPWVIANFAVISFALIILGRRILNRHG